METAVAAPLEEIRENFSFLDDWEDRYRYVIELGKALPPLPEAAYTDENKVRGCASQVWLRPLVEDGRFDFQGASDAMIVSGLIAKATQPVWQVSAPFQPNAPWPQPYPAPSPYPAQPQYPAQPSHPQQSWNVQPSPTAPFSDEPSPWQRPIDAPPERPTGQADTTTGRIIGRRR